MTVGGPRESKVAVSGVILVKKNRGIGVTYDKGISHPKIKGKKEREFNEKRIKEEISEAIDPEEYAQKYRALIDHPEEVLGMIKKR